MTRDLLPGPHSMEENKPNFNVVITSLFVSLSGLSSGFVNLMVLLIGLDLLLSVSTGMIVVNKNLSPWPTC